MLSRAAHSILRVGVAFAFLYPPVAAFLTPESWIGYLPSFLTALAHTYGVPDPVLLHAFGVVEVIIALWILSGRMILIPSVVAAAMLVSIVFFNLAQFEVLFRDLAIAAAALALAVDAFSRQLRQNTLY